jgi:heat shock protein beta
VYAKFWAQYGRALKLGIIEDATNRNRLAKLLRFYTSKSPDTLSSLEEYVGRMKPGQKDIYYLAGQSASQSVTQHQAVLRWQGGMGWLCA